MSATLYLSLHRGAGLVARSTGHRRYYAAIFSGGDRVHLVKQRDGTRHLLAQAAFGYRHDSPYACVLACRGNQITFSINGEQVAAATDSDYWTGSAGFLVNTGTLFADGFAVRALTGEAAP